MEQQQLARLTESTVPAQSFQSELSGFLRTMDQAFLQAQTEASQNSGLELSEVELTVGIDGKGKFMLLGWGVEAGTKGSIRLLFKRSSKSDG